MKQALVLVQIQYPIGISQASYPVKILHPLRLFPPCFDDRAPGRRKFQDESSLTLPTNVAW